MYSVCTMSRGIVLPPVQSILISHHESIHRTVSPFGLLVDGNENKIIRTAADAIDAV